MHGFWRDIFVRAWNILDAPFRRTIGWISTLLALFGAYWIDQADLIRRQWLGVVTAVILLAFVFRALKLAIEQHYAAKLGESVRLGDKVNQLQDAERFRNHHQQQNQQVAADRARLVGQLRQHQTNGVNLLAAIEAGNFVEPADPRRIDTWRDTVLALLEIELQDHVNDFRMPVGPVPGIIRHPNARMQYLHKLRTWLERLRDIIAAV